MCLHASSFYDVSYERYLPEVRPRSLAVLLLLACSGCATIPELIFEDDAGNDASVPAPDAASPDADTTLPGADAATTPDAAPVTLPDAATPDDGSNDAGHATTCPGTTPTGATTCCGAIPCVGMKCSQRCAECAGCSTGKVCCVPQGSGQQVTCADTPSRCSNGGGNGG